MTTDAAAGPRPPGAAAAPHPPLLRFHPDPDGRERFVRGLFDRSAGSYDQINRVFSLGSGAWYRRRALLRAGLRPGHRVLDVAVGTGLVAREAARITGRPRDVAGLDLSAGMLAEAARAGLGVPLVCARAEALPVADGAVDLLTMGYALRHVADLEGTFAEYRRVLRPGGRVLILEIGRPEGRLARAALRLYLRGVVPALSRLTRAGRDGETLMRYYWETIEACVAPPAILRALERAGFAEAACEAEGGGVFRTYTARRPPDDGAGAASPRP